MNSMPSASEAGEDATAKDRASVERVVKGGATMSPRMAVRPAPFPLGEVVREWLVCAVRGPAVAALVTKAVYPAYARWLQGYLARGNTMDRAFGVATTAVHVTAYFAAFAFFETCERFRLLRKYKLARTPVQEPSTEMKLRTVLEFTGSQVLNFFLAIRAWKLFTHMGSPEGTAPLPAFGTLVRQFMTAYILNKVGFAIAHRIAHHGPIYRAIHKKHHNYVGTVSVAAEHANPIEAVVANLAPTIAGCLLCGSHPLVWLVWLAWRLEETYEAHSGYCFHGTWLHKIGLTHADSTAYHDHHHVENKGNFGDPLMDHLFGTQDHWVSIGGQEGYIAKARAQRTAEGYV